MEKRITLVAFVSFVAFVSLVSATPGGYIIEHDAGVAKTESGPGMDMATSTMLPHASDSSTARPGRRSAPRRIWNMVDAMVPQLPPGIWRSVSEELRQTVVPVDLITKFEVSVRRAGIGNHEQAGAPDRFRLRPELDRLSPIA